MRRRIITTVTRLLTLVAVALPLAAHAALERVGPVNPAFGYPQWYQDQTGLMIDFCSPLDAAELNGGWCLILPPVPPATLPVAPETFPNQFFDEHFYWSAGGNITFGTGGRGAILTLALEGAFATGPVVPGDQIAFGRIRIAIPSVPIAGDYTVIHPFGTIESPGMLAGDRLFITQDVGIACPPGAFDCALATGIGPFLLPSAVAGGAELPPLPILDPLTGCTAAGVCDPFYPVPSTASVSGYPAGRMYIADPGRLGPVTGSPLPPFVSAADGLTYDHNIFRIEVRTATGIVVLGSTDLFSVTGRVFQQVVPGRMTVDRASYARAAGTANKLDVFATALPTVAGRIPASPPPAAEQPILVYYDAPCGVDPLTGALTVPVDPVTLLPLPENPMFSALGWKYVVGQSLPAVLPASVCVEQKNAKNLGGAIVPLFAQAPVTDQVFITEAQFNPNNNTFSVKASSSDQLFPPVLTVGGYGDICFAAPCANPAAVPGQLLVSPLLAPPNKAMVASAAGGLNERQVASLYFVAPVSNLPTAVNDAFTVSEDCVATPSLTLCPTPQVYNVLANDTIAGGPLPAGGVVTITAPPLLGTAVVNLDGTVTYTPNLNAFGADGFSYTVTVNGFASNVATAAITITPVNDFPVAVADNFPIGFNPAAPTATTLDVFGNDTDPDGKGDLGSAVNLTLTSAPAGATATLAGGAGGLVSFTPTAAGTYTFTYQAQDKGATVIPLTPLLSNVATVTVTAQGESLSITRAQYTVSQLRWVITGTYAPAASAAVITVKLANGTAAGTVVGTATNAAGVWTLDIRPGIDPRASGATQVVAIGPGGGQALAPISLK